MATRNLSVTELPYSKMAAWSGLLNGDDGQAFEALEYADRAMQVTGTFGTGGSLQLEGSNDGSNWVILADPQGNPLTFTAGKIEQVLETPRYVRPRVTAGDGTTNLVATIFCRRALR